MESVWQNGAYMCGEAASLMLMKRPLPRFHTVPFSSQRTWGFCLDVLAVLGVLANIFSFLQALSLDPLQVVMELKLEEPCLSGGDVPMPGVGLLERSTKVLRCGSIQGKWSKANPTC